MYRRSTLGYLVSLPFGLSNATAAKLIDPAWMIEGAWLVSVEGQSRDRFLTLAGVTLVGERLEVANALYGYLDGTGKPPRQWQANVEGDTIKIQFFTPADLLISVVLQSGESAILGQFRNKSGKDIPVRLTKLTTSELDELRQASRVPVSLPSSVVRSNSKIILLYVSASDCPACQGYQAEYFGRKNLMAVQLPEFSEIVYQKAFLGSYRAASSVASVLPPELAPLAMPGPNGEKPKIRCRGTPYFALIVDGKVMAQAHGTTGLETLVIPQIKQVVALRRQAS